MLKTAGSGLGNRALRPLAALLLDGREEPRVVQRGLARGLGDVIALAINESAKNILLARWATRSSLDRASKSRWICQAAAHTR